MPIEPSDPGDSTYQTYELIHCDGRSRPSETTTSSVSTATMARSSVNKDLDYEAAPCGTNSECSVRVRITGWKTDDENANESVQVDHWWPETQARSSTITINDVNETPSYAGTQTRYVAENAWRLEADDTYKRDTKTGKPATRGSTLAEPPHCSQ